MQFDLGSLELFPDRSRITRCHCRRRFSLQREADPLFCAVLSNDLKEVKNLVKSGRSVNVQNAKGNSLLNFVMRRKKVEIFDYLLSLDEVDVNFCDRLEQSPLIYLAGVCFDENFALQLITKGANIHSTDDSGFSFLHLAAKSESIDSLAVGRLIIEKGGDINLQSHYGITPLYEACESGNVDWACMLLFYGADAMIPSAGGVLPLAVISQDVTEEKRRLMQEILFAHTFCNDKIEIQLPTLVASMGLESALFLDILDYVSDVVYNKSDLQHFVTSLSHVKTQHLRVFLERFDSIVRKIMSSSLSPIDVLIKVAMIEGREQGLKDTLEIFLESDHVADFVQSSGRSVPTISSLLDVFSHQDLLNNQDEVAEMIYLMLSYGLSVTSTDVNSVYYYLGDCHLFRFLLHMDITVIESCNEKGSLAMLFYDFTKNILEVINNNITESATVLYYYNNSRCKEFILRTSEDNELLERVKNMPQIPTLVELSRNVCRKYIVDHFDVKNSAQFYIVLQRLPISNVHTSILSLEKRLY